MSPGTLAQASWSFPVVGLVIGLLSAVAALIAAHFDLPPLLVAVVAIAVGLLVTGALHEDGVADTIDGFGGGTSIVEKLAIMKDSRIGSFGVLALLVSFVGRAAAIASLIPDGPGTIVLTLLAAHAASRGVLPLFMSMLPIAKLDGLAAATGRPGVLGVGVALFIGTVALMIGLGGAGFVALLLIALVVWGWSRVARRQINGYTGDVLGALQQTVELLVLAIAAGPMA